MSNISAHHAIAMLHEADPKETLMKELGDISKIELLNTQVLVGVYIRPEKTKGGIIMAAAADLNSLKQDLTRRMDGALETLRREFAGLRTGRASVNLLDPVMVAASGDRLLKPEAIEVLRSVLVLVVLVNCILLVAVLIRVYLKQQSCWPLFSSSLSWPDY